MVESLESKYQLVGMNRKDVYNLLGKPKTCEYDYETDNKICYMAFEGWMLRNDFYCLYLDENNIVVDTEYVIVR